MSDTDPLAEMLEEEREYRQRLDAAYERDDALWIYGVEPTETAS